VSPLLNYFSLNHSPFGEQSRRPSGPRLLMSSFFSEVVFQFAPLRFSVPLPSLKSPHVAGNVSRFFSLPGSSDVQAMNIP